MPEPDGIESVGRLDVPSANHGLSLAVTPAASVPHSAVSFRTILSRGTLKHSQTMMELLYPPQGNSIFQKASLWQEQQGLGRDIVRDQHPKVQTFSLACQDAGLIEPIDDAL